MAASPPLLVLLLMGSGNKGVKRDTKAAAERLQRKGKRGQDWWEWREEDGGDTDQSEVGE